GFSPQRFVLAHHGCRYRAAGRPVVASETTDSGLSSDAAMGLDKALPQRLSSPPGQRTGQRRSDGSGRLRTSRKAWLNKLSAVLRASIVSPPTFSTLPPN